MKRNSLYVSLLAGMFIAGLASAQTEVSSVNIVGYSKLPVASNQWAMLACNFDKVGGGTNTLLDIFGTNQLKTHANVAKCDKIILWQPSSMTYQAYAQYTGVFFKANDGTEWSQQIATNPLVPAGSAMWFSPGGGASNKALNIMGQVVVVATQQIDMIPGWQMASYPFTSDIALSNTAFFASGAARHANLAKCDKVTVWTGTNYQTYALGPDGKWYLGNDGTQWSLQILASNTISLSQGFWYIARSNMVWSETNKYLSNLQ